MSGNHRVAFCRDRRVTRTRATRTPSTHGRPGAKARGGERGGRAGARAQGAKRRRGCDRSRHRRAEATESRSGEGPERAQGGGERRGESEGRVPRETRAVARGPAVLYSVV